MDSISNLPLLEISGEDDSLLFDASSATTDVFSCSPLISLRSSAPRNEGREGDDADSEIPSSLPNDGANKENMNWIRTEAQKLSVEPQKMKRKKKGGGYNLRKSLAWDRAFFTEQGVLNPTELSMINGAATANTELNLEVIHEEEPGGSSLALQEIEENLFKQSDGVDVEDRKIGATVRSSPKRGELVKSSLAPASLAKRKVLAVNDVAGNRSKRSACPRPPVASSSLKRPDTIKAPSKESKVTRIPGPKPNASVSVTTARSGALTTGSSKRNQNSGPVRNVQKNAGAGVKCLTKNPRTTPSNPKVAQTDKSSVAGTLIKRVGKHLDNSVSETNPPSRLHKSGPVSNKVLEVGLPLSVSNTVEKKQHIQPQTTKLSGLRMPSPSLGFFSQSKAPSSHIQLQKSSIPCKPAQSNIPKCRNLEANSVNEARLTHAPGIRSEIVKGTVNNFTEKDVKPEPSMQMENKHIGGVEVEYDPKGSKKISKQERVENILEHVNVKSEQGGLQKSNVSSIEDRELPPHEKRLLLESHAQEELEKEADHPNTFSNGDQSAFQEPQSVHYHSMQRTSTEKDRISKSLHNTVGQDENEQIKLLGCDILASNEILVLPEKHDTSFKDNRFSGEFKEYNSAKTALTNSSLTDFSETVLRASIQGIPYSNTEQVNGGITDFAISGDVQVHSLNENHPVYCNETTQSNLEAVNQQLQGELKTTCPSTVGEISSKKENESHANSCEVDCMTISSSKHHPLKTVLEINCAYESEQKIAEIENCHFLVDGQSGFIQRRSVDEGYEQVNDSKAMNDSTQAFELDSLSDDCIAVSATACCINVSNVSLESRPSHENNVGHLHSKSQLCPTVKSESDALENDMSTSNCCTISELPLGDGSPLRDILTYKDVQPDVPGNSEQQYSLFTHSKANEVLCEDENLALNHGLLLDQSKFSEVSTDFISNTKDSIGGGAENLPGLLQQTLLADVPGNPKQQDSMLTYSKASEMLCEDDQSIFSEVPVDFVSNTKNSISCGADNSSGLLQHTLLVQPGQEFDHANREMEEKHVEDAQVQSFNEDPVAYNCNSKHCLAVITSEKFSLAGKNNTKEDSHLSDFQRPSAVVGLDSQNDNDILHLDSDLPPRDIASSEETKKTNLFEGALEGCDIYTSNHNASNQQHIRDILENKDGKLNVDERAEFFQMNDAEKGSSDIVPFVEVQLDDTVIASNCDSSIEVRKGTITDVALWKSEEQCSLSGSPKLLASDNVRIPQVCEVSSLNGKIFSDESETIITDGAVWKSEEQCSLSESSNFPASDNVTLNARIPQACDVSSLNSKNFSDEGETTITDVADWKSEEQCSLSESSNLPVSDNLTFNARIPQVGEVSSLNSKNFSNEGETNMFEKDEIPSSDMQHQAKGGIHFENSASESEEVPTVKPPPDAAPFSDEWLAAIEAAGEEILTMKSGAVQNSPPDKPQHEPGPWSPVRRKNQGIGPFDCTKHNIQHSSS